jgi:Flp pilus assembly protein TadG
MAVRRFRYSTRDTGGQAAVEFALVLPFLLVLLIGIVEFGRAWNQHQVITDAARETARRASLPGAITEADAKKVATDAMARAGIDWRRAEIDFLPDGLDAGGNTPVTVNIDLRYRFTFFAPLVAWATGDEIIHLKTSFSMRNEP